MKKRILSAMLSLVMILQISPITASAANNSGKPADTQSITEFAPLAEDIAVQTFTIGDEGTPVLPNKLDATVTTTIWTEVVGDNTDPVTPSDASPSDAPKVDGVTVSYTATPSQEIVELAVDWELAGDANFSTEKAATYTYTAVLQDSTLSISADLPTILVEVGMPYINPVLMQIYSTGMGTRSAPYQITNFADLKSALEDEHASGAVLQITEDFEAIINEEYFTDLEYTYPYDINTEALVNVKGKKTLIVDAEVTLRPNLPREYQPSIFFNITRSDDWGYGSELTLEGSGTLNIGGLNSANYFRGFLVGGTGNKLTINSGSYKIINNKTYGGTYTPRLIYLQYLGADLEINGGTFSIDAYGQESAIVANMMAHTDDIFINGGEFNLSNIGSAFSVVAQGVDLKNDIEIRKATITRQSTQAEFFDDFSYGFNFNNYASEASFGTLSEDKLTLTYKPYGSAADSTSEDNPKIVMTNDEMAYVFSRELNEKTVYLKLGDNITFADGYSLAKGKTVYLDLNGYVMKQTGNYFNFSLNAGSTLYVSDSSTGKTGEIISHAYSELANQTGDMKRYYSYGDDMFSVKYGSHLILDDVKLTYRGTEVMQDSGYLMEDKYSKITPSLIYVSGGTVDIYGGRYTVNAADNTVALMSCITIDTDPTDPVRVNIYDGIFDTNTRGIAIRFDETGTLGDFELNIHKAEKIEGATGPVAYGTAIQNQRIDFQYINLETLKNGTGAVGSAEYWFSELGKINVFGTPTVSNERRTVVVTNDEPPPTPESLQSTAPVVNLLHSGGQNVKTYMGESSTLSASISNLTALTGTKTYQWYRADSSNVYTGTPISGEDKLTYTPPSHYHGANYYYLEVTHTQQGKRPTVSYSPMVTFRVSKLYQAPPTIGTDMTYDFSYEHDLEVLDNSSVEVTNRTDKPLMFYRLMSHGDDVIVDPGATAIINNVTGSTSGTIYDLNLVFPETATHAASERTPIALHRPTNVGDYMTITATEETAAGVKNGKITITPKQSLGVSGFNNAHWQIKYRKVGVSVWSSLVVNDMAELNTPNLAPGSYEVIARRENAGSYFMFSNPIIVEVEAFTLNEDTAFGTIHIGTTTYYLSPTESYKSNPPLPTELSWNADTKTIRMSGYNGEKIRFSYPNPKLYIEGDNTISFDSIYSGAAIEASSGDLTITLNDSSTKLTINGTGITGHGDAISAEGNINLQGSVNGATIDINMGQVNSYAINSRLNDNINISGRIAVDISYQSGASADGAVRGDNIYLGTSGSINIDTSSFTTPTEPFDSGGEIHIIGRGTYSFKMVSAATVDDFARYADFIYNATTHSQTISSNTLVYALKSGQTVPNVTSVTIDGYEGAVVTGTGENQRYELTATVNPNGASQEVIWTVQTGSKSTIWPQDDGTAILTVDANETASEITVTAASVLYPGMSHSRTFTVIRPQAMSGTVTLSNMSPKGGDTISVDTTDVVFAGDLIYQWEYMNEEQRPNSIRNIDSDDGGRNPTLTIDHEIYIQQGSESAKMPYIRVKITSTESGGEIYSAWTNKITQLGTAPDAPSVLELIGYAPQSGDIGAKGGISGLTTAMEIKKYGSSTYDSVLSSEIRYEIFTNSDIYGMKLAPGIYHIRYAEGVRQASDFTSIYVPEYEAPTNVSVAFLNEEIFVDRMDPFNGFIGAEYIDVIVSGDTEYDAFLDQAVTWKIDGVAAPTEGNVTRINYDKNLGKSALWIHESNTKSNFTITATSVLDPTKSATATVYFGSMGHVYGKIEGMTSGDTLTRTLYKEVVDGETIKDVVVTSMTSDSSWVSMYALPGIYNLVITDDGYDIYTQNNIVLVGDESTDIGTLRLRAKSEGANVTGTAISWDNVDNAVFRLYSSSVGEEEIVEDIKLATPTLGTAVTSRGIVTANADGKRHDQVFRFDGVSPGDYKLAIYKPGKYVPKIVDVTVASANADMGEQKLWLYGDVTYDGATNTIDSTQIKRYSNSKSSIFDSGDSETKVDRLLAADVNSNDSVDNTDSTQISRFSNSKSSIFSTFN